MKMSVTNVQLDNCIQEGVTAIIRKRNLFKRVFITKQRKENFDNSEFFFDNAIGQPYGTMFMVNNGHLVTAINRDKFEQFEGTGKPATEENGADRQGRESNDNRNLVDRAENQTLQVADIEQMRKEGTSGEDIVGKLVENSATFVHKTKFAQEKYIKKKKDRHLDFVVIHKATTRILCEMYAAVGRIRKILNLRVDTLSQLLAYANVHSGSNVIVCETCAGLVMGAVLERLGSDGSVIQFYHGTTPGRPELHLVSTAYDARVVSIPLSEASALRQAESSESGHDPATTIATAPQPCGQSESAEMEVGDVAKEATSEDQAPGPSLKRDHSPEDKETVDDGNTAGTSDLDSDQGPARKKRFIRPIDEVQRREARLTRLRLARAKLLAGPCDSLIVATKFHPTELTLALLGFLSPGRPFVVYSHLLQPLVSLFDRLKQQEVGSGLAPNRVRTTQLRLTDSWFRSYQVLPERTHPEIIMSGSGGFLLTGYTVTDL